MELSKLSINVLAKEKLRRRFFDNCSAKNKPSDELANSDYKSDKDSETSEEKKVYKVQQEADIFGVPRLDEATCYEDNSLPLITSVFSLASNGGTEVEECSTSDKMFLSSDQMKNVERTSPSLSCISSSDVPRCNQGDLPFVVKCSPSGVITVCSSPSPISSSNCKTDNKDFCYPSAPARTDQQMRDALNPNMVTFIDATQEIVAPAEQPCFSAEKSTTSGSLTDVASIMQQTETEKVTVDSGSASLPESNETEKDQDNAADLSSSLQTLIDKTETEDSHAEEAYIGQQVPTKQEERIRQLKDLLRQKEAELEKFRFKGKAGPVSAAAKLRANFLKKNPSLCRRSLRLNTKEESESNGTFSNEELGQKDTGLDIIDKDNLTTEEAITCESETNLTEEELSKKADSNDLNASKKNSSKFNDQDKYKLVNVTVLQGHTRTLAVPLHEKAVPPKTDTQNSFSLCSKENIATTRKRKQQMPRRVEPRRSKRKFNSEEVKLDHARSSVSRKEGNQSFKPIILKRKSLNDAGSRDGPSAPKRQQEKTFPALKHGTVVSSSGMRICPESQTQVVSMVNTTAAATSSSLNRSDPLKSVPETKALKPNSTSDHDDTKQHTATSTTGQNVAYVLHMNGPGQSSHKGNSSGSLTPDLLKRVAEGISNEVYALVGQLPVVNRGSEGDFKPNNFAGPSHVPLTKPTVKSNPEAITTQNIGEPTVISQTVASKMAVCPTSSKHLPDASGKGQATTLSIPLVNLEHSKIPNELAKLGLTCRNSTSSQSKSPLPLNVRKVDAETVDQVIPNDTAINSRQSSTTEQPKTSTQNTCVPNTDKLCNTTPPNLSVPVNVGIANSQVATSVTFSVDATTLNSQVKNTAAQPLTSDSFRPQATVVVNNKMSTGVTSTNVPADCNSGIGNSTKSLLMTVNRIPQAIKSKETVLKAKSPVPNSLYTLNPLTIPVAIAPGESKAKNIAPIKDKVNLASRPLAPKPTLAQFTSHRPIAPKPTPIHQSPPSAVILKPTARLNNITIPVLSNAVTPVTTPSGQTSVKSKTSQGTSPKPTVSQGITATNPTASEQNINILPKPVMAVPTSSSPTFPENSKNGKILVYDVVQSNIAQSGGSSAIVSKDGAKLVVYVSNTGEKRNLGIIKDQKIYLNSNQVAAVTNRSKVQSPVTTSPAEFTPNAEDPDFNMLLGLEHVVKLLL